MFSVAEMTFLPCMIDPVPHTEILMSVYFSLIWQMRLKCVYVNGNWSGLSSEMS